MFKRIPAKASEPFLSQFFDVFMQLIRFLIRLLLGNASLVE
jgi:hypothetical protein